MAFRHLDPETKERLRDRTWLAVQYEARSTQAIANSLGCSRDTVMKALADAQIELLGVRRIIHKSVGGVISKRCTGCDLWLPLDKFTWSARAKDGLGHLCPACRSVRARRQNTDLNRERREARRKERERTDIHYRVARRLRARVYFVLVRGQKSDATLDLLGCSLEEFCGHLEALFGPGMSWANYGRGGWEIDHVRPCASFDLSDPAQQRECFHFSNMQPLWCADNRKKGAKVA